MASTKFILSQYLLCVFAVIRDVFWGLRIMAAPVVLAICAMVALYVPDQTLEIYRVIVEDLVRTWEDPVTLGTTRTIAMIAASREASLSVVGLIGMAFAFWYVARLLGLKFAENLPAQSRVTRIAARWIPVVIALLPILAVAYGIRRAHTGAYIWTMWFSSLAMIGLAAVLFLAFSLIDQRANSNNPHAAKDHFLTWKLRYALYAIMIVGAFLFSVWGIAISQFLGSILIFSIFIICLTLIAGQLAFWSQQSRFPFLSAIMLLVLVFAAFDLNDNHRIRSAQPQDKGSLRAGPPSALAEQLNLWLAARADRDYYGTRGLPYPIYVVAAEGGGIYAAYHAASALSAIQDECPAFAHHTFAISAVSGGSVGASIFAAIASKQPPEQVASQKPCRDDERAKTGNSAADSVDRVFRHDFLAPLFAGMLFPDFLQRILPYPIHALDRSLALEEALERAWHDELIRNGGNATVRNMLAEPYLAHWRPVSNVPALLLNTTEVSTGRRRVISPFVFATKKLNFLPIWNETWVEGLPDDMLARNMPLSTAAVLSARFPWVTPAAWFHDIPVNPETRRPDNTKGPAKPVKVQLVDGGYFDNSGVLTALDLIREMKAAASENHGKLQINLIIVTSADPSATAHSYASEVTAPITALLNTRAMTARAIVDEAQQGYDGDAKVAGRMIKVELGSIDYGLPLGWRLSRVTRERIRGQNRTLSECAAGNRPANECEVVKIYRGLRGDTDATAAIK